MDYVIAIAPRAMQGILLAGLAVGVLTCLRGEYGLGSAWIGIAVVGAFVYRY